MNELIHLGKFDREIKNIKDSGDYLIITTIDNDVYLLTKKSEIKPKQAEPTIRKPETKESSISSIKPKSEEPSFIRRDAASELSHLASSPKSSSKMDFL